MNVVCRYHVLSLVIVLIAAFVLAGCGGGGSDSSGVSPLSERKWTYMVYMAADNNLSVYAGRDINEMEMIGSGDDVNIVVQAEFNPVDYPDVAGNTLRGRITRDEDWDVINSVFTDIGSRDMTDPQTLTEFIQWAAEYYPAQHYALVLWSHSDGWKGPAFSPLISKGVISDDSDNPGELMSLQDSAGAVLSSGVELDLINFDACLMGMYEIAYEFSGLADYIAFSEALYPSYGDAYDGILLELTASPDMDGQELAQVITTESVGYYQYLHEEIPEYEIEITKSAIDMSYIDELHTDLCSLAGVMIDNMDSEGTHIQNARDDSVSYYYSANHDLGDFLEKLDGNTSNADMKTAIQQVQATMSSLVISNEVFSSIAGDEILRSNGLAIYIPDSGSELDDYSEELSCNQTGNPDWGDFVTELVDYVAPPP